MGKNDKGLSSGLKKHMKNRPKPGMDGLDIALFGRMAAQGPYMNMQAACCFAHAISTHRVSNEIDFFTALDDLKDEPGSAHMGSLEFNSATYYCYISLKLGQLAENIGLESLVDATRALPALFTWRCRQIGRQPRPACGPGITQGCLRAAVKACRHLSRKPPARRWDGHEPCPALAGGPLAKLGT